jgi:predicted ribonuclease YlaK
MRPCPVCASLVSRVAAQSGTGKTLLAVVHALGWLECEPVKDKKIVLTRPAVDGQGALMADLEEINKPALQAIDKFTCEGAMTIQTHCSEMPVS